MQKIPFLIAGLVMAAGAALAQVTVNPGALAPLQQAPSAPGSQGAGKSTPAKPAQHPPATHLAAKPAAQTSATPPPPSLPTIPAAAPAAPVIPPPTAVPTRPAPAPSPVPIVGDAPGVASPIPNGIRLTFGEGRSELNQVTADAVRGMLRGVPAADPTENFTITSFSAGTADDPSAARRLSLARGLAVRGMLIAEGIPSPRIFVKALGATGPNFADGPPDRADLVANSTAPAAPPVSRPAP
jgi:outer membrane protein OmpA-like peptidoglycan-associated protein